MNYRNASLVGMVFLCNGLGLVSCSNNDNGATFGGLGGAPAAGAGGVANGGSSTSASGGSTASGGTSAAGGQSATTGGASSEGGAAAGGSSQGGAATGGAATGGMATGGATTGGAATGGMATGGAPTGGASSNPVTPTQQSTTDYRFTMTACNLVMNVNPQVGARVTKLTMGSTNIIHPYACAGAYNGNDACNGSGSTFWTSPQSGWSPTWPPVAAIDGNPYTPSITGTHLIATGSADATLGASVTKDFSADDGTCWITLLYTIKATKTVSLAPWEITRVPRGGIALFPLGDSAKLTPGPLNSYTTTSTATTPSIVWFDDTAKTATNVSGSKLIADGASGWLAYALGGSLFIKKFTDVLPASFAPGEGDVEIYADLSGFLELEVQGAYTALTSGGTLPWTVKWRVVPIPASVTVAARDASLLAFVQQQVAL